MAEQLRINQDIVEEAFDWTPFGSGRVSSSNAASEEGRDEDDMDRGEHEHLSEQRNEYKHKA